MNRPHHRLILPALVVVGFALVLFGATRAKAPASLPQRSVAASSTPPESGWVSYLDAAYSIDGAPVTLHDPGVQEFGSEVSGDLDGDGTDDIAFIITDNPGGSGTFYYVVAALTKSANVGPTTRYQGTNAVLLGDRIAPESMGIANGVLTVNYADRAPGEPMTTAPSVGVSKYLKVVNGQLVAASSTVGQ